MNKYTRKLYILREMIASQMFMAAIDENNSPTYRLSGGFLLPKTRKEFNKWPNSKKP